MTAIHQPPLLIYIPTYIPLLLSLVCNVYMYLSQVRLMLALKEWVNQELIPEHIRKGLLLTQQNNINVTTLQRTDQGNIKKRVFDQDALETFYIIKDSKAKVLSPEISGLAIHKEEGRAS